MLSRLYVGAAGELTPFYRLREVLQPGAARFAAVFCIIVGMLMLALWAQRRERREYAWLAALALLLAVVAWPDGLLSGDRGLALQAGA